jgi:hypothetical protein
MGKFYKKMAYMRNGSDWLWKKLCYAEILCVSGPFVARGMRGKKSTPSVGWEVLVKSQRLESGRSEGMPVVEDHLQAIFVVGYGILWIL